MSSGKFAEPTTKEAFFMLHILNNQEGKPKVNWEGVARAVNLKNGATAYARFGQIKKKIGWTNPPSGPSPPASPSKVTKNRGRVGGKAARKGKGKKIFEDDDIDIDAKHELEHDEEVDFESAVKQETARNDNDDDDGANTVPAKDEPGEMEVE